MPRRYLAHDVFAAAYDRFYRMMEGGRNRVVVSFSGGKDSGVCVELAIMAAHDTGTLPVTVVMRDEEIMLPGTFEYAERMANRVDEVDFHWVIAGQPILNVFNRANPYFWVFDPQVDPETWVRKYPGFDDTVPPLKGRQPYWIEDMNIQQMTTLERFPLRGYPGWDDWDDLTPKQRIRRAWKAHEDKDPNVGKLICIIGLRASESPRRMMGIMSSRGHMITTPGRWGAWESRPIYDWQDGDVWKAYKDFGWDYNSAYTTMYRLGIPKKHQRIAPPTLTTAGLSQLEVASRAWPNWFDRVARRLPGVRTAAKFGLRTVQPNRQLGESWEQNVYREILDNETVPDWIKERTRYVIEYQLRVHAQHSSGPFPDGASCSSCGFVRSWRDIAKYMWSGDPFAMKVSYLDPIPPEFFRPGAGDWGPGGSPNFQ